jgi:diaminopimelate decarboxylase
MSRVAHPAGPRHGDVLPADHPPAAPEDLNALHPGIWPRGARRSGGVLRLGGVDVRDLAAEFGTPLYVCDEEDVRSRCRDYLEAFGPEGRVFYAAKAFCSRAVLRWISSEGLGVDVCTGGELEVALSAGVPPEQITLHGNNKTLDELSRAVAAGVGHIVADSFEEIARLAYLTDPASRGGQPPQDPPRSSSRGDPSPRTPLGRDPSPRTPLGRDPFPRTPLGRDPSPQTPLAPPARPSVLVRVTTGVEAHTHEFMATAHDDQKFGFSLASGAADEAVRRVIACPGLSFAGLHSHIGSQIFDTAGFEVAAHRVVELAVRIRDEHGIEIAELDLGGGFGIAYTEEDDAPEVKELAQSLRDIVDGQCRLAGLARPRLTVEPGRGIVGPSTVSLYTVGTIKDVDGLRTYVSVDGGMSDNIRTALYDASYACALASRASDAPPMLSRVVGRHCESGDIVVRHAYLPSDLAPGDLLAVPATGAYCRSLASNYNHVPRPAVVAVGAGAARTIVRRETLDDLHSLDVG